MDPYRQHQGYPPPPSSYRPPMQDPYRPPQRPPFNQYHNVPIHQNQYRPYPEGPPMRPHYSVPMGYPSQMLPGMPIIRPMVPMAGPTTAPPSAVVSETSTTVFVGGLPTTIDDMFLEQLLKVCGPLRRWRRVRDAAGAVKGFGFCEYQTPDGVLRALRVLGGGEDPTQALELPDTESKKSKRLVVKADDATRKALDEYEAARPKTDTDIEQDKAARREALNVIGTLQGGKEANESKIGSSESQPFSALNPLEDLPENMPDREVISKEILVFRERAAERERQKKQAEQERLRRMQSSGDSYENDRYRRSSRTSYVDETSSVGSTMTSAAADKAAEDFLQRAERRMMPTTVDEEAEKRRLQKVFEDREKRWEHREISHARSYDREDAHKKEMEERSQKSREILKRRLSEWNEEEEEEKLDEEYYRDRLRWWNQRRAYHYRELEADKRDREREEAEIAEALEAAKKAAESNGVGEGGLNAAPTKLTISFGGSHMSGKRRAPISGVAGDGSESEDDESVRKKKRALVPLDYGDLTALEDEEFAGLTQAEKRKKKITRLVSNIPTEKEGLWRWELKWNMLDETLLENKIRPFIDKKMQELVGGEAEELVGFVLEHIKDQMDPEKIIKELNEALLELEEAEVFVVKLWRMIIFETESKAAGL